MRIIGIDPGTTESAFCVFDNVENRVLESGFVPNYEMRSRLKDNYFGGAHLCAIEMVACYGMPVGKETFETVRWIGRFEECARMPVKLVYRKNIKIHLCHSMRAKDANIRQALIDKHGIVGTAKRPGPLYGVSKHIWSALAVADYALTEEPSQ